MSKVRSKNFALASLQASLFAPDSAVTATQFKNKLLPKWNDFFDGTPVILPLPANAPPEIPRVILQSKTKEWKCEICLSRANIHWLKQDTEADSPNMAPILKRSQQLLTEHADTFDLRVARLAAVSVSCAPVETPGKVLSRHFCMQKWLNGPLNRPQSFELHAHKVFDMGKFGVNSWARCKCGFIQEQGRKKPIILFEQDINTLAENMDDADYKTNDIQRFYKLAAAELPLILRAYFPED